MIDPETGSISFDDTPVSIGPDLTRQQFLIEWAGNAVDWIVNEPCHSWKLRGRHISAAVSFDVLLFFEGERLAMVHMLDSEARFGTSWDDWSQENEMQRKASHDKWLAQCLGTA